MENECTSYNFRPFAIFVPKIIRVGGNLTKLWRKQFCLFFLFLLTLYYNVTDGQSRPLCYCSLL